MNSRDLILKSYNFDIIMNGVINVGNSYTPFSLRVSEILIGKVKKIAVENKRSINKEIEYVLEQYVKKYETDNSEIELEL